MSRFGGIPVEDEPKKPRFSGVPVDAAPVEKRRRGLVETVRGLGQQTTRGVLSGFGDEVVGGARAVMDYASPDAWGSDAQSFPDKYAMYRDDERSSMKAFENDNPEVALAANVAGSFANPINRVAPAVGATGSIASRVGQAVARGTVEGGIEGLGAGEGSLENQLGSIGTGAATGGVLSGVLSGGGGFLGRAISNRRVDPSLIRDDGSFMPIHLADPEGGIGEFYRSTIGTIPYAKGVLKAQEKPIIDAATEEFENLTTQHIGQKASIKDLYKTRAERVDDLYRSNVDAIKTTKDAALPAAKKAAQDAGRAESQKFMQETYEQSLPAHALSALEGVNRSNPREVDEAISNWWTNNGFEEVKGNTFRWNNDVDTGLIDSIKTKLSEDPDLAIEAYKAIPGLESMAQKLRLAGGSNKTAIPQDFVNQMLDSTQISGINGDALMAIRNQFAKAANKGASGRSPRAIANEIDNMIRVQLGEIDPKLVTQFDDQIGKYTTALTLKNVLRKKKVRENMGQFTPSDWAGSASKFGGKGMSLKQPPLENLAISSNNAVNAAMDTTAVEKQIRDTAAQSLKQARLDKTTKKRGLALSKQVAEEALADSKRSGALAMSKQRLKQLNESATPNKVSPWSALASTAIVGAPISFGIGALPAGLAVGRALASPKAQIIAAGQHSKQAQLAEALRKGDMAKYTQILSRIAAGQVAGG